MSPYISALFLIIYFSPIIIAQCGTRQYKVVHATTNDSALCAVDSPATTHVGDSVSLCSSRCSRDDNCLYYNYRTPLNQESVCELYNSPPQNTAVEPNCLLFVVRRQDFVIFYVVVYCFLPARRYASAGLCDSDVSVCLSVRHTPVLCLAQRRQDREMYTV